MTRLARIARALHVPPERYANVAIVAVGVFILLAEIVRHLPG